MKSSKVLVFVIAFWIISLSICDWVVRRMLWLRFLLRIEDSSLLALDSTLWKKLVLLVLKFWFWLSLR